MRVYFYSLVDPLTDEIVYIGQTQNPKKREEQHRKTAGFMRGNIFMTLWISDLNRRGLYPIFNILEESDDFETCMNPEMRERVLIREYWESGCPLLNRRPFPKGWGKRIASAKFRIDRRLFNYLDDD